VLRVIEVGFAVRFVVVQETVLPQVEAPDAIVQLVAESVPTGTGALFTTTKAESKAVIVTLPAISLEQVISNK
jgi:hypothetical protein